MTFEKNWATLVGDKSQIFTATHKQIAALFYSFGCFDTTQRVRDALSIAAEAAILPPQPTPGDSKDERTGKAGTESAPASKAE